MFRRFFAWTSKYERHLTVVAMVAGFIVDQVFFGPIDSPTTQAVFISYIVICFCSIALLHYIEARADAGAQRPRWRSLLPLVNQFALGGFWSGFIVFYGRSAAFAVSWPFLLLLALILIGNEVFNKYHDRLVFTSVLFFFAIYSFAIFEVPILVGNIGTSVFLLSGLVAVVFFAFFTIVLRLLGHKRVLKDIWRIRAGALTVLVLINLFYFTSILPPLPLSLKDIGIYHSIAHTPPQYIATAEEEPLLVRLGLEDPTLHVVPGESLYAYSAVFAPIALTTTITHRWEWYDSATSQWVTEAAIAYPITGGRVAGYDGYSTVENLPEGKWRVDIETINGLLIGRVDFFVVRVQLPPTEFTKVLN